MSRPRPTDDADQAELKARSRRAYWTVLVTLGLVFLALLGGVLDNARTVARAEEHALVERMGADVDRVRNLTTSGTITDLLVLGVAAQPRTSPHEHLGVVNGQVVAASSGADRGVIDDPQVRAVVAGTGPTQTLRVTAGDERFFVLATPVELRDETGWYLVTASLVPVEIARNAQLVRYGALAVAIFGGALLVTLLTAYFYLRRPVRRDRERREKKEQGDGGPLRVVVAEGFLSRLAFGLLSFSLPLFAHSMGMSLANIGILLATNTAVAIVLKPLMGRAIDRIGVRTGYVLAVVIRTLVVLSLVFASAPIHLFLARGLHGVSIALRDPSASTVLAALGGKKAVAQRFAWYQTAKTVAGSSGQVGAGLLITALAGDYAVVFMVATVLSAIPLVLVITGLRGPRVTGLMVPRTQKLAPLPGRLKASLAPYAILGALMTGTAYLMSNLLPVLAVEHMGLTAAAASSIYAFTAIVALSGPAWGWVADRVSLKLVLGVRAVGNIVSSLVWLFFPSYPGLVGGKIADDVGKAAFRPAWGAVMARVSALDPTRRAQTLALMSSAEDVGELGAPILAGVIWSTFGLQTLLIVRASAGLVAEVYSWWLGSRGLLDDDQDESTLTAASSTSDDGTLR